MKRNLLLVSLCTLLVLSCAQTTLAQMSGSNTAAIAALKSESLTISAAGLNQFDLSALASQTLTITTNWNLKPQRNAVAVCAYMDPATGIMKGSDPSNTDVIDQTMVQSKVGAGSWGAINAGANCGVAAATLVNNYVLAVQADRKNQTKTDTLGIQLANVPAGLQPDTYTGAITVVANATP